MYHNPAYIPTAPKVKTYECPECGKSFRHKGILIKHMALHDPELAVQEEAMIGRQRKIQINDNSNQIVDMGAISMQGVDGQQYIVLEVIQLPDDKMVVDMIWFILLEEVKTMVIRRPRRA